MLPGDPPPIITRTSWWKMECYMACHKELVEKTDGTKPSYGAMAEAAANFKNPRDGMKT